MDPHQEFPCCQAFSKADLIISPEFRNFSYRLISHHACIGFIFDNLVSIPIWWTFSPLSRPFVTSFVYHSRNRNFRNDFANALTLRLRGWKIWVKFGGTCTYAILFPSRCSRYLSPVRALKTSYKWEDISDLRGALALHVSP